MRAPFTPHHTTSAIALSLHALSTPGKFMLAVPYALLRSGLSAVPSFLLLLRVVSFCLDNDGTGTLRSTLLKF